MSWSKTPLTSIVVSVALGALAAFALFSQVKTQSSAVDIDLTNQVALWCLGRRSKAQRLAYWREQTGLSSTIPSTDNPNATVTFSRDVAPILFEHCARCHRPGEIAPFSVLNYDSVRPWAWLIGVVTATRYMPPWPPEDNGHLKFQNERRLDNADIERIQTWLSEGAPQGNPLHLPSLPTPPDDWALGRPDLIVEMDDVFKLVNNQSADVYRNFILPVTIDTPRWVRAVEIQPGSKQVVHHAIMQIDQLGAGRRADALDETIGFGGMDLGAAENPGGQFIGWSPGKAPTIAPPGMPWRLEPGTDLILQLHMLPGGLATDIKPRVGIYYTDKPAVRQPFGLVLRSSDINIKAGDANYVVEESLTLPVDVKVLGVFPHAHYIGRDVSATATLPNGQQLQLIRIKNWDFGWQDEYRFLEPVSLPAQTELTMRFVYDNSADNPRNPSQPPQRVIAGNRSTDEMAIVMLQVLPNEPTDEALIREAVARNRLESRPDSWFSHNLLGIALRMQDRSVEAIEHFRIAKSLNPTHDGIAFNLANAYQANGQLPMAIDEYASLLENSPTHPKANNNYAIALLASGDTTNALLHFKRQLELSPRDRNTQFNLALALIQDGQSHAARQVLQTLHTQDTAFTNVTFELAALEYALGHDARAIDLYQKLLAEPKLAADAHLGLGLVSLRQGHLGQAKNEFEQALLLDNQILEKLNNIAWSMATHPETDRRSPKQAVFIAELADRLTDSSIPELLDTLSAAYAADGQFNLALSNIEKALDALTENTALYERFLSRRKLYQEHTAYIDKTSG